MELDKIIYDKDTLASALIEQWNAESETFKAMYPSDTAVALANIMAGYGAMLQYMLVSAMANCYTDTVYTEMGVYQLAETLGNSLHGNNSSQVNVVLTKNNFLGIKTNIPAFTRFKIQDKKFFNPYTIIFPAGVHTATDIVLIQGERLTVTKTSSGIKNERFYFSSDFKANNNYVEVKVNGETWEVADSLLEFDKNYVLNLESLKTVVLKTDPDGRSYIRFGDGQFGSLPPTDSIVEITYVSNEGAAGNIGETDLDCTLENELVYSDNYGNYDTLDLTIKTTSTAYGGFDKQSLETLRQTSPYVFASGHRAIRRQDYDALLQNKCGYLTSKTWGEYEQSNLVGAYDSLMNNMVYYTGIKSFQYYPSFSIGHFKDNPVEYFGNIGSTKGFYGSYNVNVISDITPTNTCSFNDNQGKGLLFINNDTQDPRDNLLTDWNKVDTESGGYEMEFDQNGPIQAAGQRYNLDDILILDITDALGHKVDELRVKVLKIAEGGNGEVLEIAWYESPDGHVYNIASKDWTEQTSDFGVRYPDGVEGTGEGLKISINYTGVYKSPLIYTNDYRTADEQSVAPVQYHPINHAKSDTRDVLFYQSLYSPSLLNPVQIIIDFGFDQTGSTLGKIDEAIAGIKFKAAEPSLGTFIETVAVFGTNDTNPSFENIRNNEHWTKLLNRTTLTNPYGMNGNWTDWLPLNTLTNTYDRDGKLKFNKYRYYVIEFYSAEHNPIITTQTITFSKIKFLYASDSSTIDYDNNSRLYLNCPYSEDYKLLGTKAFPLYNYTVETKNITKENGYRDNNLLAYVYTNPETQDKLPFYVNVKDIDNGIFEYTLDSSNVLADNTKLESATNLSLDENLVYQIDNYEITEHGSGYNIDDEFVLKSINFPITVLSDGKVYQSGDSNKTIIGTLDTENNRIIDDHGNVAYYLNEHIDGNCYLENKIAYSLTSNQRVIGCYDHNSGNVKSLTNEFLGYIYPNTNDIYRSKTPIHHYLSIRVLTVNNNGTISTYRLDNNEGNENITDGSIIYITPDQEPLADVSQEYFLTHSYAKFQVSCTEHPNKPGVYNYTVTLTDQYIYNPLTDLGSAVLTSSDSNSDPTPSKFTANTAYTIYKLSGNTKVLLNYDYYPDSERCGILTEETTRRYIATSSNNMACLGLTDTETYYATTYQDTSSIIGYIYYSAGNNRYDLYTELEATLDTAEEYVDILGHRLLGKVKQTDSSGVASIVWLNDTLVGVPVIDGEFETQSTTGSGTGLKLNITSICRSGISNVPGSGGKITITSNDNLNVSCNFIGNRIDTKDINHLDQPIIEKYNHFTTFMEYVQPQVHPISITLTISLTTTASLTSNMILQNVRNNIQKLFDITPFYIGKGIKISDIYTAVMSVPNVNWCKINYPTDNININEYELLVCNYINIIESDE